MTKAVMIERMDNYLHEVIRLIHESWPGVLSAIDVVNEAIDDNTGAVVLRVMIGTLLLVTRHIS